MNSTLEQAQSNKIKARAGFVPAIILFFLAPLSAEYIIGYLEYTGNLGLSLAGLVILAPLYGGPALIIREVARKTGRGWLTIIILAFAFGLLQAGLIDHSLFDKSYEGIEDWEDTMNPTLIPFLEISAGNALNFIVGHVIWSISVPIAIVEGCFPSRRLEPWLSKKGLFITLLLWGIAAGLVFMDTDTSPLTIQQFIGAGTIIVVLVYTAVVVGKRARPKRCCKVPSYPVVGTVTLLLLSFCTILEICLNTINENVGSDFIISWGGVAVQLLVYIMLACIIIQWSKGEQWSILHQVAVAGGALLTRAWVAFLVMPIGDVPLKAKFMHNTVFLLGTIAILAVATYRIRKEGYLSDGG